MTERLISNEVTQFCFKIILPAFLAVGVKIAIEMKKTKTKTTFLNICLSMLIGVGGAYISSDLVIASFDDTYIPIVISIIAITSDKIGEFLIYHFNIDVILNTLIDEFLEMIIRQRNK